MKRNMIERNIPGVGQMDAGQLKGASATSNAALTQPMRSKEVAMSLEFLESIGGPKGEAEIHEQKPDGLAVLVDSKKYMVRFNGRLIGHYASLHDARSKANDLTGNNG